MGLGRGIHVADNPCMHWCIRWFEEPSTNIGLREILIKLAKAAKTKPDRIWLLAVETRS